MRCPSSRIAPGVVADLARWLLLKPLPPYDYHMGSFQMSWLRDGVLHSTAGPGAPGWRRILT